MQGKNTPNLHNNSLINVYDYSGLHHARMVSQMGRSQVCEKNDSTSAKLHYQTCGCGLPKWWLIEQVEEKDIAK